MGKFSKIKPVVRGERRRASRESAQFACRVVDRMLSKPLPIETATVEDIHDRGLRLVYARPVWPIPWAYMAGSVHPKHFLFNYARVNPLGREVGLCFVSPMGTPLEVNASVVHVGMDGVYETAGLQIAGQKSVKQHMTTMRSRY